MTTVLIWDDNVSWWTTRNDSVYEGTVYENDIIEKKHGINSMKITTGTYGAFDIYQMSCGDFKDWTEVYSVKFWFWGTNSGKGLMFTALTGNGPYGGGVYYFTDDTAGWKLVEVPLSLLTSAGIPDWTNVTYVEITTGSGAQTGTVFRVDYLILEKEFPPIYTLTVNIDDYDGGLTDPSGQSTHYGGTTVTVTATSDGTHTFLQWYVDGVAGPSINPIVVTIDATHLYTAHFQSIVTISGGGANVLEEKNSRPAEETFSALEKSQQEAILEARKRLVEQREKRLQPEQK